MNKLVQYVNMSMYQFGLFVVQHIARHGPAYLGPWPSDRSSVFCFFLIQCSDARIGFGFVLLLYMEHNYTAVVNIDSSNTLSLFAIPLLLHLIAPQSYSISFSFYLYVPFSLSSFVFSLINYCPITHKQKNNKI